MSNSSQQQAHTWENSDAYLQQLVQVAPIAVLVADGTGKIVLVNAKLEQLFGYQLDELLGASVEILIPTPLRTRHEQHRLQYMAQPHARAMGANLDLMGRHKDGSTFPIEVGLGYLTVQQEMMVIASINDITARKQTEALLEERVAVRTHELERRRLVADGLRNLIARINAHDSADKILHEIIVQATHLLDAQAGALYQLTKNEEFTLRQSYQVALENTAVAQLKVADTQLGHTIATATPVVIQLPQAKTGACALHQFMHAHGYSTLLSAPLWIKEEIFGILLLFYQEVRDFSDETISLTATFCDQAALAIENTHLYAQIERSAVVAERNRIAHDLHDSVTQTLFSASIIADILPRLWERNREDALQRLQELRELTRGALAEMRTLLLELRPTALTNVPLSDLLHQFAAAVVGRARVPIEVKIQGEEDLPVNVRIALYRIAQEALNNVAKHAEATHATVLLVFTPDRVELVVQDNGRGFYFDQVKGNCLGLNIMHERAQEIGAQLEIQSRPEQGAIIHAIWQRAE
ncbi:MAG: PAS domain S-box protein [Caldilineaceae bacterium]